MKMVNLFPSLIPITALSIFMGCGSLKPSNQENQNSSKKDSSQESSTTPTTTECKTPASTSITFTADVKPILDSKCVACHTAQAPVLTTPTDAATNSQMILDSVTAGRMPPSAKLSDAEIAKIQAWVTAGSATTLKLTTADPTWYGEIQAFVNGKCAYCHNQGGTSPNLSTLNAVSSRANQMLNSMQGGGDIMPPANATPQLAAGDIQMFSAWINSGKKTGTPTPVIDPTQPVYYTDAIKNLLAANCTTCHKAGGQVPDLSTYETAKAAGALSLADIKGKTMPKAAPLSDNDIAAFQKWADLGYPLDATTPTDTTTPSDTTTPTTDPCAAK